MRATGLVLSRLCCPQQEVVKKQLMWVQIAEPFFQPGEFAYWREHSPRSFVNNMAALLDVPKAERDLLGRWLPEQSDDYLRSARSVVYKVQDKVALALRTKSQDFPEDETRLNCFLVSWARRASTWIALYS